MPQTCLIAQSFVRQGLCRHQCTRNNESRFASEPCDDTIESMNHGRMPERSRPEWPLSLSKLGRKGLRSMDGHGQKDSLRGFHTVTKKVHVHSRKAKRDKPSDHHGMSLNGSALSQALNFLCPSNPMYNPCPSDTLQGKVALQVSVFSFMRQDDLFEVDHLQNAMLTHPAPSRCSGTRTHPSSNETAIHIWQRLPCSGTSTQARKCAQAPMIAHEQQQQQQHPAAAPAPKLQSARGHTSGSGTSTQAARLDRKLIRSDSETRF